MAIGGIGGAAAVSQDQFLQLLVAQLQNQDPLDPVKDQDFIAQLATFSQLQQTTQLNASFSELLRLQQLTQGVDLVGKTIEYSTADGTSSVFGQVDSVAVDNGNFILRVGDTSVRLNQIVSVTS